MRMTGVGGEVQVGGRRAAALGAWSYAGTPEAWEVGADATDTDAYWLSSPAAFRLTLTVGTRRWRWDGVTVALEGSQLTITGTGKAETR